MKETLVKWNPAVYCNNLLRLMLNYDEYHPTHEINNKNLFLSAICLWLFSHQSQKCNYLDKIAPYAVSQQTIVSHLPDSICVLHDILCHHLHAIHYYNTVYRLHL